jgi:hypothetical protein
MILVKYRETLIFVRFCNSTDESMSSSLPLTHYKLMSHRSNGTLIEKEICPNRLALTLQLIRVFRGLRECKQLDRNAIIYSDKIKLFVAKLLNCNPNTCRQLNTRTNAVA